MNGGYSQGGGASFQGGGVNVPPPPQMLQLTSISINVYICARFHYNCELQQSLYIKSSRQQKLHVGKSDLVIQLLNTFKKIGYFCTSVLWLLWDLLNDTNTVKYP